MKRIGAELLAEILQSYGVKRVFGNPGTTELPLIDAIDDKNLEFTLGLHEDVAVGMAAGHAIKKQGINSDNVMPVSVVNLHSTPGLLHGACNIYNADFSNIPMLITTGSQNSKHEDRRPSLSGSRKDSINSSVKWSRRVDSTDELPYVIRRAFRKALSRPTGPVHVDIPLGVQNSETYEETRPIGDVTTGDNSHEVSSAVELINNSNNIVIFVGDEVGTEGELAIQETVNLAEKIDADVYGELLLSRTPFDFGNKHWMGAVKHGGSPGRMVDEYDLVIEIGCTSNVPFTDDDFIEYDTPTIVASHTPDSGSQRERTDVMRCGSLESICRSITDEVENVSNDSRETKKPITEHPTSEETPISYTEIVDSVDYSLQDGYNLFEEGVTVGATIRESMRTNVNLYSNKGGGLGFGLPGSIGVQIAEQDFGDKTNATISLVGDGAFHYYPQSIYSAAKYIDSSLTILVPNNGGYEILKNAERENKEYLNIGSSTRITNLASEYGIESELYDEVDVSSKITEHIETEQPTLLEIPVDPDE